MLCPPDVKSQLFGKDPDSGKDWGQKEKAEDEIAGEHHWFNGHEFKQILGKSETREAWFNTVHGVSKSVRHYLVTEQQNCIKKVED